MRYPPNIAPELRLNSASTKGLKIFPYASEKGYWNTRDMNFSIINQEIQNALIIEHDGWLIDGFTDEGKDFLRRNSGVSGPHATLTDALTALNDAWQVTPPSARPKPWGSPAAGSLLASLIK